MVLGRSPDLEEQFQSSQFCSMPGYLILEALSLVRDFMAHAEVTLFPL